VGGDIAGGMQTVRQVLGRPALRWNPYRTLLRDVYLCSPATPRPAVHGRPRRTGRADRAPRRVRRARTAGAGRPAASRV